MKEKKRRIKDRREILAQEHYDTLLVGLSGYLDHLRRERAKKMWEDSIRNNIRAVCANQAGMDGPGSSLGCGSQEEEAWVDSDLDQGYETRYD